MNINGPQKSRFCTRSYVSREGYTVLLRDHADLPPERIERWMELLHDEDPRGRVFAATAAWAMMQVRESRRE